MRFDLRVTRSRQVEPLDVEVDADPSTSVGLLASALEGAADDGGWGLVVEQPPGGSRVVEPTASLESARLVSGMAVRPTRRRLVSGDATEVATLRVIDGPDAPAAVRLAHGVHIVGRTRRSVVRLTDPLVGERHVAVHVGSAGVDVVDLASAGGTSLRGRPIDRVTVRPEDHLAIGATTILIEHDSGRADRDRPNAIAFNRSPVTVEPRDGARIALPEPPARRRPHPFPAMSAGLMLLMAGAIMLLTGSLVAIVVVALAPLMIVGSWAETRRAERRLYADEVAAFAEAIEQIDHDVDAARRAERDARHRASRPVGDVAAAVHARSPLMWSRRRDRPGFLDLRLGTATLPSWTTFDVPPVRIGVHAPAPELTDAIDRLVSRHAFVADVPFTVELDECGVLGIAGAPHEADSLWRAVVIQIAALHSPADVAIVAFGSVTGTWLRWLPHLAPFAPPLAADSDEADALLDELERVADDRRRAGGEQRVDGEAPLSPTIVVLVDDRAPIDRSRLVQLAESCRHLGIRMVWRAPTVERLPGVAGLVLDVRSDVVSAVTPADAERVILERVESAGEDAASVVARSLAPVVDDGVPTDNDARLPKLVTLLELVGDDVATPDVVADRWRASSRTTSLRAVVGRGADGPIHLDIRAQGPHALVAGTTGSGKSELLQTWVVSLAATHSPERITFLFVDYKGGAAFGECVELPHCVGLVTDLTAHLVQRTLVSLEAEIRHRERVLRAARSKDLVELQRRGGALPSLVIVVDEFATIAAEAPEFVDGVVDIARRGRSLGLHLVLATQRPSGVISDQLRANADLRIALRVADPGDSVDVVGVDDAAGFDAATPGRAILRSGANPVVAFQAGFAGGSTVALAAPGVRHRELRFGRPGPWHHAGDRVLDRTQLDSLAPATDPGSTQLAAIVRATVNAATRLELPAPRRPWLPELADVGVLGAQCADGRDDLTFGVLDDPANQEQRAAVFVPEVDGNIAVLGTGGTGKSTFLRTLVAAAGLACRAGSAWEAYVLDAASASLGGLEVLPHVGAVVRLDEIERVERLVDRLRALARERSRRYAAAGAASLAEFRAAVDPAEPRVLLAIDGIGAVRNECEIGPRHAVWDELLALSAEARAVGIHLAVTADRPGALPTALAATIQRELVLRLANEMDLHSAGVAPSAFRAGSPPGRGFLDGTEVQVALIGGEPSMARQADAIASLARELRAHGVADVAPVSTLPDRVTLEAVDGGSGTPGRVTVGLAADTIAPVEVDAVGPFVVAAPSLSDAAPVVEALVRQLVRVEPGVDRYLFARRRSELATTVAWSQVATGEGDMGDLAHELARRIDRADEPRAVIVVEDLNELVLGSAEDPMVLVARNARSVGWFVIGAGEIGPLGGSWPLLQAMRSERTGLLIQPDQADGDCVLRTPLPRLTLADGPPGRGMLAIGGRVRRVQVVVSE